jgi:hypothetical protein
MQHNNTRNIITLALMGAGLTSAMAAPFDPAIFTTLSAAYPASASYGAAPGFDSQYAVTGGTLRSWYNGRSAADAQSAGLQVNLGGVVLFADTGTTAIGTFVDSAIAAGDRVDYLLTDLSVPGSYSSADGTSDEDDHWKQLRPWGLEPDGNWWTVISVEDRPLAASDLDFNDSVLVLSFMPNREVPTPFGNPIPEGSAVFAGASLAALGGLLLRRRA